MTTTTPVLNDGTDFLESTDYSIKSMDDEQIIEMSDGLYQSWWSAFSANIVKGRALRDFVMVKGAQWEDDSNGMFNASNMGINSGFTFSNCGSIKQLRKERGKSTYEINRIKPIYRAMYGQQLLSSPEGILIPRNSENHDTPTEVLSIVADRYRYDCYESDTPQIWQMVYQSTTSVGWGTYFLAPVKDDPMSFNTSLRFFPILDATYAFFDPRAKSATKQDGIGAGVWQVTSYRELKCAYPKKDFEEDKGQSVKDLKVEKDEVAYCNLFMREPETISIVKLDDGRIMLSQEWNKIKKKIKRLNEKMEERVTQDRKRAKKEGLPKEMWPTFTPQQLPIVMRRQRSESSKIYHIIHTKTKVLKKMLLPVKRYLPMPFVRGDSFWAAGQEFTMPLCEDAVTSQKLANYVFSEIIDNIDKSFGNVILAHQQAIGNRLEQYRRPSISNVLSYGTIGGQNSNPQNVAASRPSLLSSQPIDPTLLAVYQQTIQDINETLGRSLENNGSPTNAQSGVAIGKRTENGNASVQVYPENLNIGIAGGTRSWLEWAQYTYDTERELDLMDEDKNFKTVKINYKDGEQLEGNSDEENPEENAENWKKKNHFAYKMSQFSIECKGGLSFAAQRDRAIEAMLKLMEVNPQALPPLMMDLIVAILPFPFANQLKMRLRESGFINQQVLAIEKGQKPPKPEQSPEDKLMEAKFKGQIIDLISSLEGAKNDRLKEIYDVEKALADGVADISKDFAEAPSDELAQALNVSKDALTQMTSVLKNVQKSG